MRALLAAAALLASLVACGGPPPPILAPASHRAVVIISMDGMRHDYPQRVEGGGFARLAREGAIGDRLIPPFPSQTFPGHASLATGVTTDRHGIMNNRFKDRVRGAFNYGEEASWYDAMPLWIHATRSGVRTHVFHWVGSQGDWQGTRPAIARDFDKSIDDDDKVDAILDWLRGAQPPGLVMSYFLGCDHQGHSDGPDASSVTHCVEEADARVGRLLDGLAALPYPVTLLLVSDHGMTQAKGSINLYSAFEALDFAVEIIPSGPIAHVFVAPKNRAATLAFAQRLPHVAAWTAEAVPDVLRYRHPTRTGDVVLQAEAGWHFSARADTARGNHGHDPGDPEMGVIFYAWGAGIRPGSRVERPRAVDVVPTACQLLGIPVPEGLDGQVLAPIMAPAPLRR
ncbi:MAG: ectonucleotide pyrophosphatase/phosphodiesterase [bacterium]